MHINADVSLSMGIEFKQNEQGKLSAFFNSLDQKAYDIPIDTFSLNNSELKLTVKAIGSIYKGKLSNDNIIEGFMKQGDNASWKLDLKRVDKFPIAKAKRPQVPKKPYPYNEEDVSYSNPEANITICGTLSKPKGTGKYPAVLLITGSGPNTRDEHIFGHKVFLVLSDYLTRQGFAVLRVDDRGVGESTGVFSSASINDLASDVRAGINYLKTRNDISQNKVGVIGHSLGCEIAMAAAAKTVNIDFVISMSGSGIPLSETIYDQCEAAYSQMGASKEGVDLNRRILESVFMLIKSEKDNSKAKTKIAEGIAKYNDQVAKLSLKDKKILELRSPLKASSFYEFLSPAMRVDLFLDPKKDITRVECPVLAINGSKDVQVIPTNLKIIEKCLKQAKNKNFTIKEFEGKNHLFQTCQTGSIEEYTNIEETISPEVLKYISNWMKQVTNKKL